MSESQFGNLCWWMNVYYTEFKDTIVREKYDWIIPILSWQMLSDNVPKIFNCFSYSIAPNKKFWKVASYQCTYVFISLFSNDIINEFHSRFP